MEDLLQEVQLQLQQVQAQLEQLHMMMTEMDHEQQQQSILIHELEATMVEVRKYTMKELMRQKIEQKAAAEAEQIATAAAMEAAAAAAEAARVAGLQQQELVSQHHELISGLLQSVAISNFQQTEMAKQQLLQAAAMGNCQLRLRVLDRRVAALETSASTLIRNYPHLAEVHQTLTTSPTTSLTPAKTKDPSKDDVPNENSSSSSSSSSINADN